MPLARTRRNLDRVERLLGEHAEMGPNFDASSLRDWQERARLAVRAVYGEESAQLKRFDGIKYHPTAVFSGMDRSIYDRARRGGAVSARAQLDAIAEDIRETSSR